MVAIINKNLKLNIFLSNKELHDSEFTFLVYFFFYYYKYMINLIYFTTKNKIFYDNSNIYFK